MYFYRALKHLRETPSLKEIKKLWWWKKIAMFHKAHKSQPASLSICRKFNEKAKKALKNENPLIINVPEGIREKIRIKDLALSKLFCEDEFYGWKLCPETVNFLVDFLLLEKPKVILELGSGISTLCLCEILQRVHGPKGFKLLSIEQNKEECTAITERLKYFSGHESCRIIYAPLDIVNTFGQLGTGYNFKSIDSEIFSWLGQVDAVLIDGPFAKDWADMRP